MIRQDSEGTIFSCGEQAMGCLLVKSILLETVAFCNSSDTNRNSLPCIENISSSIREKPESVFQLTGIGENNRGNRSILLIIKLYY